MEAYRVFISSIMNAAIEDLAAERVAAKAGVERFAPVTVAWAFEAEPASAKPLLDFYLGAAKDCDLFLLILGQHVTKPVRDEVQVACDHRKPMLVFCKKVPSRDPDTEALLRSFDLKYDQFETPTELHEEVRLALGNQLLASIRGEPSAGNQLGDRLARLRGFKRQGKQVSIIPTVPTARYNSFSIEEVTSTHVQFQLGGFASVWIPAERIAEVLETGSHQLPIVHLTGRLQFVTPKQNWYFFPEPPLQTGFLNIGIPKHVPRLFSFSEETLRLQQACPYEVGWSNPDNVPGREVFYDVDGRYLTDGRQILTCTRTVR